MITRISQSDKLSRQTNHIKKQSKATNSNQNQLSMMQFPSGIKASQYGLNFSGKNKSNKTIKYSGYYGDYKFLMTDESLGKLENFKEQSAIGTNTRYGEYTITRGDKNGIVEIYENIRNNYGDITGVKHYCYAYIDDENNVKKLKILSGISREEKAQIREEEERKEAYKLVLLGRLHEAYETSKDVGNTTDVFEKLGINKDGRYSYYVPSKSLPYIESDLEDRKIKAKEKAQTQLQKADEVAEEKLPRFFKQNREIKKTLTLGFSERIRDWQLDKNKSRYVEKVTEEQDYEIDRLLNSELNKIHSRENDIKGTQKITSRLRQLLTKKERVKEILDEKINSRIIAFSKNDNVKVPNCVMMVGPNPYIAKELAEWSALTTDSDFTVVDSSISNDKMQDNLMRALEESEENWQENHRRTIIFVEGMEKLLSPELNSAENIAGMKDMMQYADEDCRATIFFHSFDPKKLDSGTLAPHRVGVTVDVPITYSEAKIVKKGE